MLYRPNSVERVFSTLVLFHLKNNAATPRHFSYYFVILYFYENEKSRYWCFAITSLNIKIINKSYKNKTSKQTCLQIIALLNITTNTSIKKIINK